MIRDATADDIEAMVAMAQAFVGTHYRSLFVSEPQALRQFAERMLASEDAKIFLAVDNGDPIGLLAMCIYRHPVSDELVASEVIWWVDPNRRGVGVRMLKRAEGWAKERGAVILQMVAPTGRVAAFYEALKFEPVEMTYQKRL